MSKELPGDWGKLLEPKGIHSYRDLAQAADIPVGTAHRLVTGKTSAATVNRVADELFDGNRDLVWELRGSTRRDHGDWELPDGSSLLTPAQRSAVRAVIVAMLPEEREGTDGLEGAGPSNPPAPLPHLKAVAEHDPKDSLDEAEETERST